MKEILLMILFVTAAIAIFVKSIDAFVAFNLWLGELMGWTYK